MTRRLVVGSDSSPTVNMLETIASRRNPCLLLRVLMVSTADLVVEGRGGVC